MKTREQIYSDEAADLLRTITMYRTLLEEQIYRLYPGKEKVTKNLLSHLVRQGRVHHDPENKRYSVLADFETDSGMMKSLWILIDFIEKVEFHTASDFPVKISFLAGGEMYDIIHIPYEQEQLMNHALSEKNEFPPRRILLVDDPEQIPNIHVSHVAGFCAVNEDDGTIQYYKLE